MKTYELTLWIIPSPFGIDWSSPQSLTTSTVRNHLTSMDRNIGHVMVEIKRDDGEKYRHFLAGMVGVKMGSPKLITAKGYGLGILFENFRGRIERTDELQKEISKKIQTERLSFVRYIINEQTCNRIEKYFDEYEKNNYGRWYGLPNNPRKGEGAGCSAFGASFLAVAGLLTPEHKENWSLKLRIPMEAMGGPHNKKKWVPITSLLSKPKFKKWASENEDHKKIFFWDPDQMHNWVLKKVKAKEGDYQVIQKGKSFGLIYNMSKHIPPTEDIWLPKEI